MRLRQDGGGGQREGRSRGGNVLQRGGDTDDRDDETDKVNSLPFIKLNTGIMEQVKEA